MIAEAEKSGSDDDFQKAKNELKRVKQLLPKDESIINRYKGLCNEVERKRNIAKSNVTMVIGTTIGHSESQQLAVEEQPTLAQVRFQELFVADGQRVQKIHE